MFRRGYPSHGLPHRLLHPPSGHTVSYSCVISHSVMSAMMCHQCHILSRVIKIRTIKLALWTRIPSHHHHLLLFPPCCIPRNHDGTTLDHESPTRPSYLDGQGTYRCVGGGSDEVVPTLKLRPPSCLKPSTTCLKCQRHAVATDHLEVEGHRSNGSHWCVSIHTEGAISSVPPSKHRNVKQDDEVTRGVA